MKSLYFTPVFWTLACGACAWAQVAPKAPVLHRAPAFASWTVTLGYQVEKDLPAPNGQPQPPPEDVGNREVSLTVTKTNKSYWEQSQWSLGGNEEKWIIDGLQLITTNNGRSIVPLSPPAPNDPSPDYADYNQTDFPGLEWVSLSTYKGIGSYQGKPVYQFEATESGVKTTAYLSTDTQLPLYSSNGYVSYVYTYNPPPTTPLVLPPRFASVVAAHKRGLESLKYHPSPP